MHPRSHQTSLSLVAVWVEIFQMQPDVDVDVLLDVPGMEVIGSMGVISPIPRNGDTLQGINISHLGKRNIIFIYALSGGYVSFLEGIPSP